MCLFGQSNLAERSPACLLLPEEAGQRDKMIKQPTFPTALIFTPFLAHYHPWGFSVSQANARVPVHSFLWDLIRNEMIKQLPIMAEAAQCIWAEGLKTALLSHSLCLGVGERSLPLDQQHFDVVSLDGSQMELCSSTCESNS